MRSEHEDTTTLPYSHTLLDRNIIIVAYMHHNIYIMTLRSAHRRLEFIVWRVRLLQRYSHKEIVRKDGRLTIQSKQTSKLVR